MLSLILNDGPYRVRTYDTEVKSPLYHIKIINNQYIAMHHNRGKLLKTASIIVLLSQLCHIYDTVGAMKRINSLPRQKIKKYRFRKRSGLKKIK